MSETAISDLEVASPRGDKIRAMSNRGTEWIKNYIRNNGTNAVETWRSIATKARADGLIVTRPYVGPSAKADFED